ncbi:MAG: 2-dehydropantoate 2-reductase [Candidatus Gastranaerophilales bacterium]|nr:2-dehydropantoate 2-reductase [Candidatus Gastranaerophilales bacterium]
MKIGIVGIGAVGGYYGAKLAQAGYDVTFIGTPNSVEVLSKKGLKIKSYKGDFHLKNIKVFHDFKHINDADVILFCVKSYNTEAIAKALKPRISKKTAIVSMQNGVDNEEVLADIFGKDRIIGAVVYITSSMPERGIINHTAYGNLVIGEMNEQETERIKTLEKMFLNAGVATKATTKVRKYLWKKLMLNIAYNGFAALTGKNFENYHKIPQLKDAFYGILKEVQLVAKHDGYIITNEDVNEALEFTKSAQFREFKPSTLQDAEAGKPLEIDALQGAVIRTAEKHNLDIPMNTLLYALLKLKFHQ